MEVNKAEGAATHTFKGQTYYFCVVMCRDRFAENPERFVDGLPLAEEWSDASPELKAPASMNGLERLDLPVRGMSCASCVERIEKGIGGLEGVNEISVNFAAEKATVFMTSK